MKPLIEMKHVSKTYQPGQIKIAALKNVSTTIYAGEFVAVMGRSGSGKSTFLKILGTLEKPDAGEVYIDGTLISQLSEHEICKLRQKYIGFVFQQFRLLPEYTIWDNICMPLYIARETPDRQYLQQLLTLVGLWKRRLDFPDELSGGEQQRAALARAMAARPKLLLADEPTGNLDYSTGRQVMRLIRASREIHRQTIVMVTHDMESANYADRIIRIEDGELL